MLGREAAVVLVVKRPSGRQSHERSTFVRRVLNKQDKELFRKLRNRADCPIAVQIKCNSHLKEVSMMGKKFLQSIFIQVDNCDARWKNLDLKVNQPSISEAVLWMSPTVLLKSRGKKLIFCLQRLELPRNVETKSEFTIVVSKEYILSNYHTF